MGSEQGERWGADEAPYQGALGKTRAETVQVWMPDGRVRALSVYVGVNAVSDPGLATLARAGTLHLIAEGVSLAMPFVFHDPHERAFLLVLPDALRHRVLSLRAEHLAQLALDTEYSVPGYVRDVEVVVGAAELNARLASGTPAQGTGALDTELVALRERAYLERERQLLRRERMLTVREQALGTASPGVPAVQDAELEEVDDDSVLAYERAVVEAELSAFDDQEQAAFDAMEAEASYEAGFGEEPEHADDQVEEIEDVEPDLVASAEGDDDGELEVVAMPGEATTVAAVMLDEGVEGQQGVVFDSLPRLPETFAREPGHELFLSASDGHVWLFVRGAPPELRADTELELLLQVDPEADVIVPMITLVLDTTGVPDVRRAIVDPIDPEQRAALRLLAKQFVVQLVSVTPDGELDHWAMLHAPRESNASALVALLEVRPELSPGRFRGAAERWLEAPPLWRDPSHPFQLGDTSESPRTATEAAVQLDELAEWLEPERRERLRLLLCVSDEVVDAKTAEGISHALDWGLSLPDALAQRAIELGIAVDEPGLVMRRIAGLTRTSREEGFGGLEESVLRTLWSEVLEAAARSAVPLSGDALEAAKTYVGERAQHLAEALAQNADPDLAPLRDNVHEEVPDIAHLLELSQRGGYSDLLEACRATERVSCEDAVKLFVQVARRAEQVASDALLSLLTLRTEALRVRAGAALALSERRSVDAIDELARHVATESDSDWPVFAFALGRYGAGSFRAIARALTEQEVSGNRAELVLAHLALHGARSQVRAKTRVEDAKQAQVAQRALTLASELKSGKKPASGLEKPGSVTVFSELFDRNPRDAV